MAVQPTSSGKPSPTPARSRRAPRASRNRTSSRPGPSRSRGGCRRSPRASHGSGPPGRTRARPRSLESLDVVERVEHHVPDPGVERLSQLALGLGVPVQIDPRRVEAGTERQAAPHPRRRRTPALRPRAPGTRPCRGTPWSRTARRSRRGGRTSRPRTASRERRSCSATTYAGEPNRSTSSIASQPPISSRPRSFTRVSIGNTFEQLGGGQRHEGAIMPAEPQNRRTRAAMISACVADCERSLRYYRARSTRATGSPTRCGCPTVAAHHSAES